MAQLAPQDLPDVGLGQRLAAELDDLRHLVAGEVLPAMIEQGLLGQRRILLYHDNLDDFARAFVGLSDGRHLGHARCSATASSIWFGKTLNPETTIMSFLRSVMRK